MPQSLKTGEAIKGDAEKFVTAGKELIDTGKEKTADAADRVKEAVKPKEEHTFMEKMGNACTAGKETISDAAGNVKEGMGNAYTYVKDATVG